MPNIQFDGRQLEVSDEGFLVHPEEWNDDLALFLARQEENLESLTEEHWAVIRFMRTYYEEHHIAPDARHVMKHLGEYRGPDQADRNDLFRLFPYGYVKQACKIAGMRRPRAWSTG